jgi:tetratricopeptide (TPR) repeat protein
MRRAAVSLAFLLPLLLVAAAASAATFEEALARGDAAWARRAEGHRGGRALPGPVDQAIAAYEEAVAARPADLAARARLLRALYFRGDLVAPDRDARRRAFERGREVAEAGIDRLAAHAGGRKRLDEMTPAAAAKALAGVPYAPDIHLWAAVHWGLWGDAFGRLAAARQGVADKMQRYSEIVIALDERFEAAGGHRLLGRLHSEAPKIPLVTGWVDRAQAIAHLRRAVALAPDELYNQLFLAEALLDHAPARKAEALAILRRVVATPPPADRIVEVERAREDARALLKENGG